MRNLTAITHAQRHLNLSPEFGLVQCTAADEEKRILFLGGSGLHIACISANDFETRWTHDLRLLAEAAGCTIPLDASLAAFAFSVELEVLCIGLSSGHLLLLHHSITSAVPSLEEVGQVEGGVVAAAWSPDGEAVAILGGLGQLLLMTSSWDVLCETPVADNAPDFPQPTAPPEPESEGESCLSPGSASVCWRGDGKYLATCSASAAGQPPRVRIWDRELAQLHALGETAPGLQAVMDWQPNCRHLYVAQRRTLAAESGSQEEGVEDLGPRGAQGQAPEVRHVGAWKRELRRREEAAKAAGTAATPNGVILFERNGLHHGRFDVPCFGDGTIEAMRWSPDSQLLAVVLATGANDAPIGNNGTYNSHADHARVLQLWHRSNWHWYLKHERRFACCDGLSVSWEEGSPGVTGLRAVTAEGLATATSFVWDTCTSALGTVAVVDGNSVLLTPLRLTIVPPPMSAVAVALPAPAVAVALRQHSEDEALAAVLSDGRIAVVECCEDDLWEETLEDQLESTPWDRPGPPRLLPRVLEAVLPADTDANALVRHVTWIGANALLLTTSSEDGDNLIKVDIGSSASGEGAVVKVTPAPGMVVRCVPSAAEPGCIIETEGGNLWKYAFQGDAGEKELELLPDSLPVTCPRVRAPRLPPSAPAETLLGLSADGALFLGNRLVAREVTSFALRDRGPGGAFLLYTTRAQALCTLPLATLLENRPKAFVHRPTAVQEGGKYQPPVPDITLRAIEDNALLVAVPADDVCAIYQAPRGNLELVRPRALVLPAVAAALDAGDYERAWSLATVNRLDLNVLVDYRWPKFLSQAAELLRAVGSDVDVADFLALLNPGSVAAEGGAYANVLSTHAAQSHANAPGDAAELLRGFGVSQSAPELQSAPPEGGNKVAAVCAAVREAIFKGEVPRHQWLRTELTTHSKCGDVAAALLRVKDVKDAAMAAEEAVGAPWSNGNGALQGGEHGAGVGAEQGLKHLLLHSSEEEVYRAALGSYELELAYMVVAHSQRDPGEYLLELQRFAAITDAHLRGHAIDLHLRRYDGAVRHLLAAADDHFPDALALARQHGLLRLVISLTKDRPALHAHAHIAAGEDLENAGRHEDAALAFSAAGDLERALRAYRLAGQWRPALALAARLGREPDKIQAMAARMAVDLADGQRQAEAAAVILEYLDDVPGAVALLAEAGEWRECVRVAYARGRGDLVDTTIAPAAAAASVRILESVSDDVARVEKYWSRLKEIRHRRETMAAVVEASEAEEREALRPFGGMDDAASEVESMVSGLSAYTMGTAVGTATIGGSGASSVSVWTVGGRKKDKRKDKGKKGKSSRKIRHGSPEEEAQLALHVLSLSPLPELCAEVGQLTELLVMLGHAADAELLQRKLKLLIDSQAEAARDVVNNPSPGQGLVIPDAAKRMALAAAGLAGPAAMRALETAARAVAGPEVQRRAAEAEAALRGVHWKWEVLRDP